MSDIFEERFVVFIDMLGFGAMVSDAAKRPEGAIAKCVDTSLTITANMKLLEGDRFDPVESIAGFHNHIFSDCIVMSVQPDPLAVSNFSSSSQS